MKQEVRLIDRKGNMVIQTDLDCLTIVGAIMYDGNVYILRAASKDTDHILCEYQFTESFKLTKKLRFKTEEGTDIETVWR
jgi:hypothetical protein